MPLICFSSPKGGVGKTTLAANVAGGIARAGNLTIAIDLDPQNALRLHFGVPLGDGAGFTARLGQRPDWRAALRPTACGVNLLPYGATDMPGAVQLAAAIGSDPSLLDAPVRQMLSDPAIYVVVDTAPGPSPLLASLLPLADLLVTVLLVDATSVSLIPALDSGVTHGAAGSNVVNGKQGFVLNQLDPRTRLGGPLAEAATRHLGPRLLGIIYRDEHVAEAVAAQKLVADYAPGAKAAFDLAELTRTIVARLSVVEEPRRAKRAGWLRR